MKIAVHVTVVPAKWLKPLSTTFTMFQWFKVGSIQQWGKSASFKLLLQSTIEQLTHKFMDHYSYEGLSMDLNVLTTSLQSSVSYMASNQAVYNIQG